MIDADGLVLRPWRPRDVDALVRYANNRRIWLNLTDRFPHPYTRTDAEAWIARCAAQAGQATHLAIDVDGVSVGGVGFDRGRDVYRLTADIGYWLAEPFWGRGLATVALRAATTHAFARFDLERLQAAVFEWNPASVRVLEKAGYGFEGRLRRSITKDGRVGDTLLYARLRGDGA
jgi:RimJ/RimL family protein N-acetyltransferase